MEIAFKFDHPDNNPDAGKRPERFKAARNMSARGPPSRAAATRATPDPAWPAYDAERRATMLLDAECRWSTTRIGRSGCSGPKSPSPENLLAITETVW